MVERVIDCEGIWIPKEIWYDKRLNINQKFYLSIYEHNFKDEFKTDNVMKQIASKSTICSVKKSLRKMGLIDVVTEPERAKLLVMQRKWHGDKCEWCGCKTYALQEHHYPVPKCKGGVKTVMICPNCHAEYHLLFKDGV